MRHFGYQAVGGVQARGHQTGQHLGRRVRREHNEPKSRAKIIGRLPEDGKGFVVVVNAAKLAHVNAHHAGLGVAQVQALPPPPGGVEAEGV